MQIINKCIVLLSFIVISTGAMGQQTITRATVSDIEGLQEELDSLTAMNTKQHKIILELAKILRSTVVDVETLKIYKKDNYRELRKLYRREKKMKKSLKKVTKKVKW